jgi:hypothetical protein
MSVPVVDREQVSGGRPRQTDFVIRPLERPSEFGASDAGGNMSVASVQRTTSALAANIGIAMEQACPRTPPA